jgi:hypothetical protein
MAKTMANERRRKKESVCHIDEKTDVSISIFGVSVSGD